MTGLRHLVHRLLFRGYYRLVQYNYRNELLVRTNQTAAGAFATYELVPRHRTDSMLAAIDAHCASDAVIYDVGANAGAYALGLTADAPDRAVVAFEPGPRAVAKLQANRAASGLESQVSLRHCGLGAHPGEHTFYESTLPELSGFDRASATRWGASVAATHRVPMYRLDDVVDSLHSPDVIKLDVEGAGASVLRGAGETLEAHTPTVFIEVHDSFPETVATMRELLVNLDYEITQCDGYWRCDPPS